MYVYVKIPTILWMMLAKNALTFTLKANAFNVIKIKI